jgi:hypothetical protein
LNDEFDYFIVAVVRGKDRTIHFPKMYLRIAEFISYLKDGKEGMRLCPY